MKTLLKRWKDKMEDLVIRKDKEAVTTSLEVAKTFGKKHKNVLCTIDNLLKKLSKIEYDQHMFTIGFYKDSRGKLNKMYYMNNKGLLLYCLNISGHIKQKKEITDQLINQYDNLAISEYKRKFQKGYVCLIKLGDYLYRIGYTKNIDERFKKIYSLNGEKIKLYLIIKTNNYCKLKSFLQDKFVNKLFHNDWYILNDKDLNYIRNIKELEEYEDLEDENNKLNNERSLAYYG